MVRFDVVTAASADMPLRVLNLFAQQDLAVDAVTIERAAERYHMRIAIPGMAPQRAAIILEKIRAFVLVERAEMAALAEARLTATM